MSFLNSFDITPSLSDDSHMLIQHMPKKLLAESCSFRRPPLFLSLFYVCHIRKGTPGERNLYLLSLIVCISLTVS